MDSSGGPRATSTGATLETLPAELTCDILARIMPSCTHDDLHDLYKAVRTSKTLYATFKANRYLLTRLGKDSLHHFPLALAAVRATRLVENALKNDQLVPADEIIELVTKSTRNLRDGNESNGDESHPTLAEFSAVIALDKFTEAARNGILDTRNQAFVHLVGAVPLQPIALDAWCRRFHISMYRLMIIGAALSGAYLEPFFQTKMPQPRDFLSRIVSSTLMFVDGASSDDLEIYEPSEEDIEYYCRFPLYRCRNGPAGSAGEHFRDIFKPVVDWLLEDMKYEESEAAKKSLPLDTLISRAPWLFRDTSKETRDIRDVEEWRTHMRTVLQEVPYLKREEDIRATDSIPMWPVSEQIQEITALAKELSSTVQTDRWGRGLLIPDIPGDPDTRLRAILTIHRADGTIINPPNPTLKSPCRPLVPSQIAATRVIRYGNFVPEVLLSHIPTDRTSCETHGRALLLCHAAHEKTMADGWKPPPQPYLGALRTSNGTFQLLFGGATGRMLRLERVFFNLFVLRHGPGPGETHPGLFTYLSEIPRPDIPEATYRLFHNIKLFWNCFWGDQITVLAFLDHLRNLLLPENERRTVAGMEQLLGYLHYLQHVVGDLRRIPGSYTIF
ncbi:hypothetical protein V8F20_003638 [Naviculisporaceae sp. PSN 640]